MLLSLKFILLILKLLGHFFDLMMACFYIDLLFFDGVANDLTFFSNLLVDPQLLKLLRSHDSVYVSICIALILNLWHLGLHLVFHLYIRLVGDGIDLHTVKEDSVVLHL